MKFEFWLYLDKWSGGDGLIGWCLSSSLCRPPIRSSCVRTGLWEESRWRWRSWRSSCSARCWRPSESPRLSMKTCRWRSWRYDLWVFGSCDLVDPDWALSWCVFLDVGFCSSASFCTLSRSRPALKWVKRCRYARQQSSPAVQLLFDGLASSELSLMLVCVFSTFTSSAQFHRLHSLLKSRKLCVCLLCAGPAVYHLLTKLWH